MPASTSCLRLRGDTSMSGLRYEIGNYEFRPEAFFPRALFARTREPRVTRPEVIEGEAAARRRRERLTTDGRLTILAADHPARMVLGVGDDPAAMGHRWGLLARILRGLHTEELDGVMATPDIVEELLIVNRLDKELGGPGFLDHKVLLGCMNRGGLAGAGFELDDRMTGYTPERIAALRLDGAKMMFRLDPGDPASLWTIEYCVRAIDECHGRGIPVFLEALYIERADGKPKAAKHADALIRVVSVATGLGASTALTWLKIPYCEHYERVAQATTCPILMLGGGAGGGGAPPPPPARTPRAPSRWPRVPSCTAGSRRRRRRPTWPRCVVGRWTGSPAWPRRGPNATMRALRGNLVVGQSGGPTAVPNPSP